MSTLSHQELSRTAPVRPFALNASVLASLLAASSAPTPLYPCYQESWGLSPLTITVVFSAYALALLGALLTVGSLSDHLGRRPVLIVGLLADAVSMMVLAGAHSAGALIAARILQGLATGTATSAAGAVLLDLHDPRHPGRSDLTNSIAPAAGMAVGVLAGTLLVWLAPAPTATVYVVLATVFLAQAGAITLTAETAHPQPGALASLRPHLSVPGSARRALLTVGTSVAAIWALGGFYSSLGPALIRLLAPSAPQVAAGLIFFALSSAAALTVWTVRNADARTAATAGTLVIIPSAALTLIGLHGAGVVAIYAGATLAGVAFGAVSQGALRLTLASIGEQERASTLAAYYVLSYLSMSLPAIAAGAVSQAFGLRTTAHACAIGAALLAAAALAALTASRTDN